MKSGLYLRYTTRSLQRGGRRTVLAAFCVGVGVMAIVGLQLAAAMVSASLTANVREANGGDISVVSVAVPLPASQLQTFARLRAQKVITNFTAVREYQSTLIRANGQGVAAVIDAVNPADFPLVGSLPLQPGALGTFTQLIRRPGTMVLSGGVASLLKAPVGSRVRVNAVSATHPIYWTVGGVLQGSAPTGLSQDVITSMATLSSSLSPTAAVDYAEVYVTTSSAQAANRAAPLLRTAFPLATVSTVQQALNSDRKASQQLTQFLSVAGLAALLIGGIGIVNTMQVSLSRRRLEIAMLKTTGYRRRDLYLLFGLEAALLGLVGGIAGAGAGIVLSDGIRALLQNVANLNISFVLNWGIVLAGVGIGVATTCIFAILPIVRLSRVRPAAVLRDDPGAVSVAVIGSSALLLALVGALFWLLASAILGSAGLALGLVIGTGVALAILTGLFSLCLWLIGRLPVPERFTPSHLILVTAALLVSIGITRVASLRAVGALLIAVALLGYLVVVLPRPVQSVIRLALRNAARQRTRTAATAVALFVGVFAVGLILVLGTDIRAELDSIITQSTTYNVVAVAPGPQQQALQTAVSQLHPSQQISSNAAVSGPVSLNGAPFASAVGINANSSRGRDALFLLTGIQGFNLHQEEAPPVKITAGHQLTAADMADNGVLLDNSLQGGPYHLKLGDRIGLADPLAHGSAPVVVTVVGFYSLASGSAKGVSITFTVAPVLANSQTVTLVGGAGVMQVVEMKFPPNRADAAATKLRQEVTGAQVVSLADFTLIIDQFLNNAILFLTAIASLALLAGIVIIANSVALALLERRREIGIQKAVGQGSRAVFAQVLIETAAVAWLGATGGMLGIALALLPLGRLVIKISLGIPTPLALAIVLGAIVIAVATAALVAWGPVRIRPLEVLRYE
ncbi:MAG: ABC transporter permease [Candidatus Dormibacteria bacterium]